MSRYLSGDVQSSLMRRESNQIALESMGMAQTFATGFVVILGLGEFQTDIKFPFKFNGAPLVYYGLQLSPTVPITSGEYPNWQATTMEFYERITEHNTPMITGCRVAGFVTASISNTNATLSWLAVGQGFGGAS